MVEFKDQDFAINLKLMKRCGFCQIFNPNGKTIFNFKVYRWSLFVFIITTQCLIIFGTLGYFNENKDTISEVELIIYVNILIQIYLVLCKLIIFLYRTNTMWEVLFNVTRLNFMTSKHCCEHLKIMSERRDRIIKITNIYFLIVSIIGIQWMIYPLIFHVIATTNENDNQSFMPNILNFRFPIDARLYNQYYRVFYAIEGTMLIFLLYGIIFFNMYVMSLCLIITSQFKVLSQAFENIGHQEKHQTADNYEDLKSVLFDQQRLYLQVKSYYSVVRIIVLTHVTLNSVSFTLLSFLAIWMCTSLESIPYVNLMRLGSTALFSYLEIFVYCYLFENLNQKMEAVSFSIYSCNWTMMDMKFQKLLLLAMRMHDVNQLMLKTTPKKIINLQLFTSITTACYNVVSVMLKTMTNKNRLSD